MENMEISGSTTLALKILLLKAEKSAQEAEFNQTLKELKQLFFNPAFIIKDSKYEQPDRKRELLNLSKLLLNMGTDYVIEQSFGKRQNFRDFLGSIMFEIVSTPLINRNITKLFMGLNKQLFGKSEDIN
jgi:hypothetical protein